MFSDKKLLIENIERGYGKNKEQLVIGPVLEPSDTSTKSETNVQKGKGEKWPQYCAALSSTLGAFALGTVLGWITPADAKIRTAYDFPVNNVEVCWIGALTFVGMVSIIGFMDWILAKFGRKNTMLLLLIPYTIGWLFTIFATNFTAIYIGGFITGFAIGGFCVTSPLYIAEIAHKEIRGALGTMFPIMITIGILFTYVVGNLRYIFGLSILITAIPVAIPLLLGFIFYFQPESPLYLVRKNQMDEARNSLIQLRGRNYDVDLELKEIVASEENCNPNETDLWQSLTKKSTQKALLIASGTMGIQQLTSFIMSYITFEFQTSGGALIDPGAFIILVDVSQLLGNLIGVAVVDTRGRKYLLTRSALCMALSLFMLALLFNFGFSITVPFTSLVSCIYGIAYSVGFGSVPWVIIGEIFPSAIKNKAAGIALIFNLICSYLVAHYFDRIFREDRTFCVCGLVCVLGAVFVHFVVVETKGKSLNEIQRELENENREQL